MRERRLLQNRKAKAGDGLCCAVQILCLLGKRRNEGRNRVSAILRMRRSEKDAKSRKLHDKRGLLLRTRRKEVKPMRLIDANDLLAEYDRQHKGEPGKARKLIENAPAVDAVEVVRCKDCRHITVERGLCFCNVWEKFNGMGYEGFCNYGERRSDEQ